MHATHIYKSVLCVLFKFLGLFLFLNRFKLVAMVIGHSILAAVSHPCSSVYRGFAECLVTLGDSVSSKTDNPQDINSICKSWDAFQVCVSGVLLGCRGDAAEMWESLRAESRKTVFAGNLYDMCASRLAHSASHSVSKELLLICFSLLLLLWM
uniref:Neuritin 1-like b n=1 Tax=Sinocyclocheilus rhinocerous TaxID=307959 RepID=A0A673IXW7_9TELE